MLRATARNLLASVALAALVVALVPTASAEQEFDSGDIASGASWSFTFTEVFEDGYAYHCHPHPWMTAMVHVVEDSDGAIKNWTVDIIEPEDPNEWGYSIEHLVVEVGDTVTWNNTGLAVHTVTKVAGEHDHAHDDTAHDDTAHDDGHADDHDDGHDHGAGEAADESEDAPGLAVVGVLAGVATVLLLRRR